MFILLKINKTYFNNYPLTLCQITNKGKKAFKVFFDNLKSIKNNGLICLGLIVLNKYIISYCESFSFIKSPGSDCTIFKKFFTLIHNLQFGHKLGKLQLDTEANKDFYISLG